MDAKEELRRNLKLVIETYMEKEDFEYHNAQLKKFKAGKARKPIWVKTCGAGYFKNVGAEEVGTEESPASGQGHDRDQEMPDIPTSPTAHKCQV